MERMISFVVPCYNCEKTFERCIGSIRNQTYNRIEIVLVDDGSTDQTYALCEEAAKKDARMKAVHQNNGGLMNAWKRGVREASGEYIAFCDSDDYIENDLAQTLIAKIKEQHADVILYGMAVEYAGSKLVYNDNRLAEGYHSKEDIEKIIWPRYFSSGDMQSEIIVPSRDVKAFKRDLLMKVMDHLNDTVTVGEDELTSFAVILSANSIYCMKQYFPYHYIRNDESMIGGYDAGIFDKMLTLRNELVKIAGIYGYPYSDQIEKDFVSHVLVYMKKEICRNRKSGYGQVKRNLVTVRENAVFSEALKKIDIKKYQLKNRVFAGLVIRKQYLALYALTNLMSALGMGKA